MPQSWRSERSPDTGGGPGGAGIGSRRSTALERRRGHRLVGRPPPPAGCGSGDGAELFDGVIESVPVDQEVEDLRAVSSCRRNTRLDSLWTREAYRSPGWPAASSPLAAPVSVFRRSSRSMSFVLAGRFPARPGWAPRSGRSTLTSPQRRKDRQLRRGDDGPTSESKRNVLGKKSQWVPLRAELEVSARQRFIVDGHNWRRTWPAAELARRRCEASC